MNTGQHFNLGGKAPVYEVGNRSEYPVAAGEVINAGDAVGENGSGYARQLQGGDTFLCFAEKKADNSIGSAGDINVRGKRAGNIRASISGLTIAQANSRRAAFMSDHETFTLTSLGNSLVGFVSAFEKSGVGVVEFDSGLAASTLY